MTDKSHGQKLKPDLLYIAPIGGCGQFGMNTTLYYYNGQMVIVDTGVMFPDPTKLGTDAIIPDLEPWFERFGTPDAYLITHGHEDHVGAIAFAHTKAPAPIYATSWTATLIGEKFATLGLQAPKVSIMRAGDELTLGNIQATWVHLNHSIPMNCGLRLKFGPYRTFHSGDFKIDPKPVFEEKVDRKQITKLGSEGIDVLLSDSTNALSPGRCPSESTVLNPLTKLFKRCQGLCYLTTFSSNLWRLLTVLQAAKNTKRSVYLEGTGLKRTLQNAAEHNLIPKALQGVLIDDDQLRNIKKERLIVMCTGCQGEPMAALSRIVRGEHRQFKIKSGDTIIFSSRMIPGNERTIAYMVSEAEKLGAKVITPRKHPNIHVSGHAYQEDLADLMSMLKPKTVLPVHGTFSQLLGQAKVTKSPSHLVENGDIFTLGKKGVRKQDHMDVEWCYVDAFSKQLVSKETLRQRLKIGQQGLVVIDGVYDLNENAWVKDPRITLQGISDRLTDRQRESLTRDITRKLNDLLKLREADLEVINTELGFLVRRSLMAVYRKKLVVVPVIHLI